VLHLTPGHHADITSATELVARAGPCRRLIADRAYDAERFRQSLHEAGTTPVIPGRRNRTVPIRHDRRRYRERWRIEATIGRLKDFRRVASRFNDTAPTELDTVTLAAIHAFWL
jgi:transposase